MQFGENKMKTIDGIEMNATQLATLWGVSARSIQLYRVAAEKRFGRSVGVKRGKGYSFSPEDQDLMTQVKESGIDAQQVASDYQQRTSTNFDETNSQCESSMLANMSAIAERSDAQAVQIGSALGQRFVGLVNASMMREMTIGLMGLAENLGEIQAGLTISLPPVNEHTLAGNDPYLLDPAE
jgi:hypothetical protein